MSCPASFRRFKVGRPKAAVPAKTMRSLGADEFRFLLLLLRLDLAQGVEAGQTIGEQDAVEVVDLVLDSARQQRIALDLDQLALPVHPPRHHLPGYPDFTHKPRNEKTAPGA